jgi:hypothetical protein
VYPFSCSEITFRETSAAQIFIAKHSSRISSAEYPNFSCPYHSPVKAEHIVKTSRINYSVNITNVVHVLNFGVMMNKFNANMADLMSLLD